MITNLWWHLPEWVQKAIQPKDKTELTAHAYKEDGQWYFDLPQYLTFKESLLFPEVLDEWAGGKDKASFVVSLNQTEGAQKVYYEQDDPTWMEASIYVWKGQTVWLCPWLQWYFGFKPETLWVTKIK